MHAVRRFFGRRNAAGERLPLKHYVWTPENASELDEFRNECESLEAHLRQVLALNEETRNSWNEEVAARSRFRSLEGEVQGLEEAAEAAEECRREQVTTLRRRSLLARDEVFELQRKSVVHDSRIAELREQVETAAAARAEFTQCEHESRKAQVDMTTEHKRWLHMNERQIEIASDSEQCQCTNARREAAARRLAKDVEEAQREARRRDDCYWSDAPFLAINAETVIGYESQIMKNDKICTEIEEAISKESALHEEALQDACEAVAFVDGMLPASASLQIDRSAVDITSDTCWPAGTVIQSALGSPECSPRYLLERAPLSPQPGASAVQSALATLHSENERLRQKVKDLQSQSECPPPCSVGDGNFNTTVANTGSRVVHQMKHALHEDVALLRTLHQIKQELDGERQRERQIRAVIEKSLAVASASFVDEQ